MSRPAVLPPALVPLVPLVRIASLVALAAMPSPPARAAAEAADPAYVVEIIDAPGFSLAYANGLDERGDLVGRSSNADGTSHAVRWHDGVEIDLGADGEAFDINDRGIVVGVQAGRATRWFRGHGRVMDGTWAGDINQAGWIVGQRGDAAMRWFGTRSFRVKGLPGSTSDMAVAIDEIGEIVGNSQVVRDGEAVSRGFFRSLSGRLTELAPAFAGEQQSTATAMNDLGQSVGVAWGGTGSHPMLWNRDGHGVALPQDAATGCHPSGLDDGGRAVGWCTSHGDLVAVAWDPRHRFIDLNVYLSDDQRAAYWHLTGAYAVNRRGWITGAARGQYGKERPFVMKPVAMPPGP